MKFDKQMSNDNKLYEQMVAETLQQQYWALDNARKLLQTPNVKGLEFETFKKEAGLNKI